MKCTGKDCERWNARREACSAFCIPATAYAETRKREMISRGVVTTDAQQAEINSDVRDATLPFAWLNKDRG